MKQIVYRKNHKFYIDIDELSPKAKSTQVCNALYAAIYAEFMGADQNPKYSGMTYLDRFNKVNEFANNWLKERGLN